MLSKGTKIHLPAPLKLSSYQVVPVFVKSARKSVIMTVHGRTMSWLGIISSRSETTTRHFGASVFVQIKQTIQRVNLWALEVLDGRFCHTGQSQASCSCTLCKKCTQMSFLKSKNSKKKGKRIRNVKCIPPVHCGKNHMPIMPLWLMPLCILWEFSAGLG